MTRGVRRGCGLIYKGLAININQLLYLSGFIYLPIMQLAMTTAALLLSFAGSLSCLLSKCRFLESNFLFPADSIMESYQGCVITNCWSVEPLKSFNKGEQNI